MKIEGYELLYIKITVIFNKMALFTRTEAYESTILTTLCEWKNNLRTSYTQQL